MPAIKVENLSKKFNGFTAVDQVSFDIEKGELFGLLGQNGAGKTTIINMLSTLLEPTSGFGEVAGYNIAKSKYEVRENIGIVFQGPALDNKLTGKENLVFHAMMYKISKEIRNRRLKEVLELVELTDKADILVENYSGGMKRRLEIARGLIHRPKVLFLDEPTLGLDTQTRRHIWDYIKRLNKEGEVTIILTTHYMEEADFLCNRIAIIDYGKIITLDSPGNLKDILGGDIVSLEIENDIEEIMNRLGKLDWIRSMKRHNNNINLTMEKGETRIPELINIAHGIGINVNSVSLRKPSLEDVYIHFTGKSIREQETSQDDRKREMIIRSIKK